MRARVGVDQTIIFWSPLPFIRSHGGEGRFYLMIAFSIIDPLVIAFSRRSPGFPF